MRRPCGVGEERLALPFARIWTPDASRSISCAPTRFRRGERRRTGGKDGGAGRSTGRRDGDAYPPRGTREHAKRFTSGLGLRFDNRKGSESSGGARVPRERAALDDVDQLRNRLAQLVLRVVEVRPEPDAGVRPEVADDAPLAELAMHGGIVRRAHEHGAAAARGLARARDLEARRLEQLDEERREPERALADAIDPDLLDHVVAGARRVQRRHVRSAGQERRTPGAYSSSGSNANGDARDPASRRTSARAAPRGPASRTASLRPARRRAT